VYIVYSSIYTKYYILYIEEREREKIINRNF
jgi:hypothetical protein